MAASAVLAAMLLASVSACSSTGGTRQTVTLDSPMLDDYRVVYAPFEGCMVKQALPQRYSLTRPLYRLDINARQASSPADPSVEVLLSGDSALLATFPGVEPQPRLLADSEYQRYLIPVTTISTPMLTIVVSKDGNELGQESLTVESHRCRTLAF